MRLGMLQSRMRLCSMRLCSKLLGGCGLTHAAFYQISTDSMLSRSLSGSWTSCLVSLQPFIKILRSLCYCMKLLRESLQAYSLLGVSSMFAKAQFSFFQPDVDCGAEFFDDDLASCQNSLISYGICESPQQTVLAVWLVVVVVTLRFSVYMVAVTCN